MHIDDEITATEEMIALDRANAAEVLASTAPRLNWDAKTVAHFQNFIDSCLAIAASILAECRAIAAMPDVPRDVAKQVIEPLLLRPYEATRSMYLGMLVIECVATALKSTSTAAKEPVVQAPRTIAKALTPASGSIGPNESGSDDAQRSCSFCGKTESETNLVAGPSVNICAACTRLAAAVHGMELAD